MSTTLGSNIKSYRKNKGITQEELASLLNVTPQAVSKWESGASLPDVSMLVPLAQIFGVSTDVLLGYDLIAEQEEETHRIRKTMWGIRESEGNRAENALKACEYLMTETNLHPSNYSIITSYAEFVADLSMFADPKLEGYFQDQADHINEIYNDEVERFVRIFNYSPEVIVSYYDPRKMPDVKINGKFWHYGQGKKSISENGDTILINNSCLDKTKKYTKNDFLIKL